MNDELIAHAKQDSTGKFEKPHLLKDHLEKTANMAASFADSFNSGKWGYAIGYMHDIGKTLAEFQKYIRFATGYDLEDIQLERKEKVEHSGPGAKLAIEYFNSGIGRILSFCIAGHHAGLPDWYPDKAGSQSALCIRLDRTKTDRLNKTLLPEKDILHPNSPPWQFTNYGNDISLWIRMLFSCLVDADFLDTENYMDPQTTSLRSGYLTIRDLKTRFDKYMEGKLKSADKTRVNEIRLRVLEECRKKATENQGIYSLTVPTGGGKTLSSLAFALDHAEKHDLDRIIYVIPYTSIIEQNADVFKKVLGKDQVVEHHSSIAEDETTIKSRLSADNWDAPVIVTTSVQFFESLFSCKSSRCRKLHNIANSVVILDEAQLLPVEFLKPILNIMELLTEHYRVTFVVSTATQPALESRENFKGFAKGSVREIISDIPFIYKELKRVNIEMPSNLQKETDWKEVSEQLLQHEQVLCVVSDRKSCRELHRLLPKETLHLSALMCGQHRSDTIERIKCKLDNKQPVRVVSTQLVEAGVDFDFPVVYRALAGLDSIAQAAGRCNREGKMEHHGKVVVFKSPKMPPAGILRKAAQTTETLFKTGLQDPLNHIVFERYFNELYWKVTNLDAKGIMQLLSVADSDFGIQFRTASESFKIIDDSKQKTILVPYGDGKDLIGLLKTTGPQRWLLRKLQRYGVNVYNGDFACMLERSSIKEISSGIYALTNDVEYSDSIGLIVDNEFSEPDIYIF
jgi:CRISPR-associated endonuclease/helicase Cas3